MGIKNFIADSADIHISNSGFNMYSSSEFSSTLEELLVEYSIFLKNRALFSSILISIHTLKIKFYLDLMDISRF